MSSPNSSVPSSAFREHYKEKYSREFEGSIGNSEPAHIHYRYLKENSFGQGSSTAESESDRSPTISSTHTRLPTPCSSSSETSQDRKSTSLPSIKELEKSVSRYQTSSPDMSGRSGSRAESPYPHRSQDVFAMKSPRDDAFRNSGYRDLQGEPYSQTQPLYYRAMPPPVTSISPSEIHKNPYPTSLGREAHTGVLFGGRRNSRRGDPEYVKRPRRRAEEVERLYTCKWPGCDKAYGALNHLNTHVRNAEHGPKREPKEFKEVRRQQKAKLARLKMENNPAMFQMNTNSGYHTSQYANPANIFDYARSLPRPSAMNPHSYEAVPFRGYESTSLPANFASHESFSRPPSSRERHDTSDRDAYNWPTSSPSHIRSGRWSPENFKDLQSRYPIFAEELLPPPMSRAASPRRFNDNVRLSPRDMDGSWDDRYESIGHASYIQGPNGSHQSRDGHYTKREF